MLTLLHCGAQVVFYFFVFFEKLCVYMYLSDSSLMCLKCHCSNAGFTSLFTPLWISFSSQNEWMKVNVTRKMAELWCLPIKYFSLFALFSLGSQSGINLNMLAPVNLKDFFFISFDILWSAVSREARESIYLICHAIPWIESEAVMERTLTEYQSLDFWQKLMSVKAKSQNEKIYL